MSEGGILITVLLVVVIVFLLRRFLKGAGDERICSRLEAIEKALDRSERLLREEMARNREELRESMKGSSESVVRSVGEISGAQHNYLENFSRQIGILTQSNEQQLEQLRQSVSGGLQKIQEDNSQKLDMMRQTVDEKLQGTLERRLGESFKLVSERLELVQKGLGEMNELANGVGDLKRILTNVKTRGTWGEIQLGAILEQILIPEQYAANVAPKPGSAERVEFAIRLPGRDDLEGQPVWLPIDAKFPKEDYERLTYALERADPGQADEASRRLGESIRKSARDIRDKYISPPHTTDFAILFLPVEGLYAEVIRQAGLVESLQQSCRVIVAGPTTLAALLNALQMGFRTLAIQKRSSEVWKLLGAVKTEFSRFTDYLEGIKKKIHQASDSIEDATKKSRQIQRRLKDVQELPVAEVSGLLGAEFDETNEHSKSESVASLTE
ncbi:MAG: DNA recombination protein RmuC [bacterium]